MKTLTLMLFLCGALIISGCKAGITRTGYQLPQGLTATNLQRCPIALQCNTNYSSNDVVVLGTIHDYDTGFSTTCDEAYVLDIFVKEGCMLGADVINITEEKQPDFWSTCYRASGQFLRFKDRDKADRVLSNPRYAPNLIIERSVKANKRTRELIATSVFGGVLGGIAAWEITAPHSH